MHRSFGCAKNFISIRLAKENSSNHVFSPPTSIFVYVSNQKADIVEMAVIAVKAHN